MAIIFNVTYLYFAKIEKVIYILKPLILGPGRFYKNTVSENGNSVYK
jgi:hypothetical protein